MPLMHGLTEKARDAAGLCPSYVRSCRSAVVSKDNITDIIPAPCINS